MKVNCRKARESFKVNNEKFANLKVGSQFMTDIKKMITHPMRNPYDDTYTKNNVIVMQEYRPPSNQLYGTSPSNSNRNPNNAFYQANSAQRNNFQNAYSTADILSYASSTPSTQYYNFIQNQKQSKPYILPTRTGKTVQTEFNVNTHTGQTSQAKNLDIIKYSQNTQSVRPTQIYQRSVQSTPTSKQQAKLKDNTLNRKFNNSHLSKNKQVEFGIQFSKQQLNQNLGKLNAEKNSQAQFANIAKKGNDTKQSSVSSDTPPEIITKTLAFRRIIKDPNNGNPKSRITFKTWIVRPSRNSKLIVEPTPYTYNRPANFLGKVIADISNDNNVKVTTPKVETETINDSYVYKAPTIKISDQILTNLKETADFPSSTATPEAFTGYELPSPSPTEPALLNLVPTTFKPSSRLYLPPTGNEKQISRQYLSPIIENSKLVSVASSPRPFLSNNKNEPSFVLNTQTPRNNNYNNLAFTDILTKEKLDTTVNEIVKDTNGVLETASPPEFQNFNPNIEKDYYPYLVDNHVNTVSITQSEEKLTLQPPPPLPKSSKLIAAPSLDLQPPYETVDETNKNSNPILNLPYFDESTRRPNTIERTVSLKITIPENIAHLLFKNRNTSDSENLEILNTGNINNWVLYNKVAEDTSGGGVIPIGKLILNKTSNVSNSQDLVLSLLVDSINAAKDYNNQIQQNIVTTQSTPTQPQFQAVKNEELQRISNDISRLTSSQYSAINSSSSFRLANLRATSPSYFTTPNSYVPTKSNSFSQKQSEQQKLAIQQDTQKQKQIQPTFSQIPENNEVTDLNINSDKLYSGQLYQLPVPVVSKQFYNSIFPGNYKSSGNAIQANPFKEISHNKNVLNDNIIDRSNANFEIIQSHNLDENSFQSRFNNHEQVVSDQGSSANAFIDKLEIPKNGITAQLQDNIVGTIPHPIDDNKEIKYKKDQTYYIYTQLNNDDELSTDEQLNNIQNILSNNLANGAFSQNQKLSRLSAYELIPSLGYKLENEGEKQNILNAFQINEYGVPKQVSPNGKSNIRRQDLIAADVDFSVDHPKSTDIIEKPRFLYDGPSSYSAPQKSVGNLAANQNRIFQGVSNINSKIEKFDTDEEKSYGYPKIRPVKRFTF